MTTSMTQSVVVVLPEAAGVVTIFAFFLLPLAGEEADCLPSSISRSDFERKYWYHFKGTVEKRIPLRSLVREKGNTRTSRKGR